MGRRGPAPKPSHLKVMQGTYRKDRAPTLEATPEAKAPSCPTWLGREAKREWRRIAPLLEELGLITELDRAALAAYCHAYEEWWEMERVVRKRGQWTSTDKGNLILAPWTIVRNQALTRLKQYLALFGLSPSDRSRVSAIPPKAEEDQDEAFLMGGRRSG